MFADAAFSEAPFSSLAVGFVVNGEIFFFDQDIDRVLNVDGDMTRAFDIQAEIEKQLSFDLHILY